MRGLLVCSCVLGACAAEPAPPAVLDLCSASPAPIAGGSAQLGLGGNFSPMVDGQDVLVVPGPQGQRMVVVNVRVDGLEVGPDEPAAVDFTMTDPTGAVVSTPNGCRSVDFRDSDDGLQALSTPYALVFLQGYWPQIDGARLTVGVDVRDQLGHHVTDHHVITTHMQLAPSDPFVGRTGKLPIPRQ